MSKKTAVAANGSGNIIPGLEGTILYDQKFETELGTIFVKIDLRNIMYLVSDYQAKLMQARRIPMNQEAISPADPLVKFVTEHMTWVPETDVIWTASQRYAELANQAYGHAAVLAITAVPENNWEFDPAPYEQEAKGYMIPGDVEFPEITYNLRHPLERRLKQLMDMMETNLLVRRQIEETMTNTLIIVQRKLAAETDQDGFRPKSSG